MKKPKTSPMVAQHPIEIPVAHRASLDRAAEMILKAKRPLIMLGAAAVPAPQHGRHRRIRPPYANPVLHDTDGEGNRTPEVATSIWGRQRSANVTTCMKPFDRADLIIAIGHDTIEKPPFIMGPKGPQVIHVSYTPANVERVYFPQCEVVGDVGPSLELLADRVEGRLHNGRGVARPSRRHIETHYRPQHRGSLATDPAAHRA